MAKNNNTNNYIKIFLIILFIILIISGLYMFMNKHKIESFTTPYYTDGLLVNGKWQSNGTRIRWEGKDYSRPNEGDTCYQYDQRTREKPGTRAKIQYDGGRGSYAHCNNSNVDNRLENTRRR